MTLARIFLGYFRNKGCILLPRMLYHIQNKAPGIREQWSQNSYHPRAPGPTSLAKKSKREIKWRLSKFPITQWGQLARVPRGSATVTQTRKTSVSFLVSTVSATSSNQRIRPENNVLLSFFLSPQRSIALCWCPSTPLN